MPKDYYQIAHEASAQIGDHQGLQYLQQLAKSSKNILDIGCGEGTRLNTLLPKDIKGTGVDISKIAIKKAKEQYPRHRYIQTKGESLPFKDNSFDLVYTAFVLEHTENPEYFLKEAKRVLKPKGSLVILCPNYGAPNRRSPNSIETPIKKLISGIAKDFIPSKNLNWTKVTPKKSFKKIDDDTTQEPYLLSLIRFLKENKLKILKYSSLWEKEEKTKNPRKLLFLILGKLNIFPFKYWGPQIFLSVTKK